MFLGACLSLCAAPAAALAADGGAGLGPNGSGPASSGTTSTSNGSAFTSVTSPIAAVPADNPVSASGNGLSIATYAAGTLRKTVTFTGSVPVQSAGSTIEIQRETAGEWVDTAHATVTGTGAYTARWRANHAGQMSFRALLAGAGSTAVQPTAGAASAEPASPAVTVAIFTDAVATIYGPGFYGHKTACGQTLHPDTVGVASRTLHCGREVEIYYDGQSVTVPVIDRGPFANGASWDLTMATAKALGVEDTETVGTIAG